MNIEALRQQAIESNKHFSLDYYTDKGPRFIDVFLVRFSDGISSSFSVYAADDGRWLAHDDIKKDALSLARISLHQLEDFGIPIES